MKIKSYKSFWENKKLQPWHREDLKHSTNPESIEEIVGT